MMNVKAIIKSLRLMNSEFYSELKEFSREEFLMFVGNLVDQYGADHGMNSNETCKMLEDLSKIQKEVHDVLGCSSPMPFM